MILQFRFSNYRSFKDDQNFSMIATKTVSKDKEIDKKNIHIDSNLRILKTSAIYGANASGKSNIVKAISIMKDLVINSARSGQFEDSLPYEPFLLDEHGSEKPTSFEIIFKHRGLKYRYGFEYGSEGVISEWLFRTKAYEVMVFEREGGTINLGRSIQEASSIIRFTRDNALFISVLSQFNIEVGKEVLDWFTNLEFVSADINTIDRNKALRFLQNGKAFLDGASRFLGSLDIGISGLEIEDSTTDAQPKSDDPFELALRRLSSRTRNVKTIHKVYNSEGNEIDTVAFDLDKHESDGTRKLFHMLSPIINALSSGTTVILDEIDARLHPLITESIIRLFSSDIANTKCAQLIFTTHDTNLLQASLFRRDQIWFVEKSSRGESNLYSLADYEPRNDINYEKNYLAGKYGAIPFINSAAFVRDFDEL